LSNHKKGFCELKRGLEASPVRRVVTINVELGNTKGRGRFGTVDLLIRVAWFVKMEIMYSISKAADLN
jgi:hypothetical protein